MSNRRSAKEWSRLLSRYERSGKSQKSFCGAHGISTGSLQYHLARRSIAEVVPAVPAGFVELGSGTGERRVEIEIVLPSGAALRLRG